MVCLPGRLGILLLLLSLYKQSGGIMGEAVGRGPRRERLPVGNEGQPDAFVITVGSLWHLPNARRRSLLASLPEEEAGWSVDSALPVEWGLAGSLTLCQAICCDTG